MVGGSRDGSGVQPRPLSCKHLGLTPNSGPRAVQQRDYQGFLPSSTWSAAERSGAISLASDKVSGL
jgi:hypothetical protein